MVRMMTVKEAAERWGVSERWVTGLCSSGRVPGAVKHGRSWSVPENTEKPSDRRSRDKQTRDVDRLPLPIGVSDYRTASTSYYYADKTLLIRDFLDERPMVSLFTRPRGFGKTLNMDMLRVFFELSEKDTSVYFRSKKIWRCGKKYRDCQGKYPVIFITFKDCKYDTWEYTYEAIRKTLAQEALRHPELKGSPRCDDFEKSIFNRLLSGEMSKVELSGILRDLSAMLHKHHGVAPVIIIEDYDVPIQQGHICGFYDEAVSFLRNLFSGGLKDNPHLTFGFLTGILRLAQDSVLGGLNNIKVNTVLDSRYSEYFGLTPDEIRTMAAYYHSEDKIDEICEWYGGYRFGHSDIFAPYSVIRYFGSGCRPGVFWQAAGSNDIINDAISVSGDEIANDLKALLSGKTLRTKIDSNVVYPQMHSNPSYIYSFLLMAGYLTPVSERMMAGWNEFYDVAIPNKEVSCVCQVEILEKLERLGPPASASSLPPAIHRAEDAV